jgi:hypothetical protein
MEMTEFKKLLDSIYAERIAHNDYFKANERNLDLKRLYGFEQRIYDMFDAAGEIIRAVGYDTPDAKRLQAIAAERAKLRPKKLLRDPKVIREEARQHVEKTKRKHKEFFDNHYLKRMSASEREEWEKGQSHLQERIDSQGGNCTECGEPLDVNGQLVAWGRNNTLICETCTVESMEYHGDPIL